MKKISLFSLAIAILLLAVGISGASPESAKSVVNAPDAEYAQVLKAVGATHEGKQEKDGSWVTCQDSRRIKFLHSSSNPTLSAAPSDALLVAQARSSLEISRFYSKRWKKNLFSYGQEPEKTAIDRNWACVRMSNGTLIEQY